MQTLSKISASFARAICRLSPGTIKEILDRRRTSFWYKTSQSEHEQRVWGYANRHSIVVGESFQLMLSAGPDIQHLVGHLEIFRIGYFGKEDRELVWSGNAIEVGFHDFNSTAATVGPNWPPALRVSDTNNWHTGYHSVDFVFSDGERDRDIAFLVVRPEIPGDVHIKLATATYQAYNRWGGHSFYRHESPSAYRGEGMGLFESDKVANQGSMISFDRPTRSEFYEWEYYYVLWIEALAEKHGFSVTYTTNFDFSVGSIDAECRLLVSVGHDEYWTKEEFDKTYERIFEHGSNTLFLGSNTAYWQVRYVDVNGLDHSRGRQLICHKSEVPKATRISDGVSTSQAAGRGPYCEDDLVTRIPYLVDPIRECVEDPELYVTSRFRDDARCPETMLTGVAYQSNLKYRHQVEPRFSYYVTKVDLPFFEGTDWQVGDKVADIIGHEWDNRDPEVEYPPPGELKVEDAVRLWNEKRSRVAAISPDRIQVVMEGDVTDTVGRRGRAEAVFFESDAGAKVFCSGTNRWSWALGKGGYVEPRFQKFNENLILHFLRER